jgi:hypothetical protein
MTRTEEVAEPGGSVRVEEKRLGPIDNETVAAALVVGGLAGVGVGLTLIFTNRSIGVEVRPLGR